MYICKSEALAMAYSHISPESKFCIMDPVTCTCTLGGFPAVRFSEALVNTRGWDTFKRRPSMDVVEVPLLM